MSYVISKSRFSLLLNGHIGPLEIMLMIQLTMVYKFEHIVQSLLNTCLFDVCS